MADAVITKQPVYTNSVQVQLSAPSGTVGGEYNAIEIPDGHWKINSVFGIKEGNSAATDTSISVGVMSHDLSSFVHAISVCSGAMLDGQILPAISGTDAAFAGGLMLSGNTAGLVISGGEHLYATSTSVGTGGNAQASLFINLTAV